MSKSKNYPFKTNSEILDSSNELLKDYSHNLAIPATTTALGYGIGGLYGALLGLGIGGLDEALYHNGYTEKRYFSSMFIGAGMFISPAAKFNYNALATTVGSTLALGLSTGVIEQHPIIIQATENAILAGYLGGSYGIAAGVICASIDVGFEYYNVTSYAHCSSALKGFVFTKTALSFLDKIKIATNFKILDHITKNPLILPGFVGAYSSYITTSKPNDKLPALKLAKQLHDFSLSVVDKKEVNDIFEKLALVSAGLGVVAQKNMNAIFGIIKTLENIPYNEHYLKNALTELSKLFYHIIGYQISNLIQGGFVSYFLYDLQTRMEENTYEELYRNETILKVQKFPDAENQLDWIGGDILTSIQGLRTVTSAISTYTTGILAYQNIVKQDAFNIVVLTSAFGQFTGQITENFAETTTLLWGNFIEGMSGISKVKKGVLRHSEDIILNRANEFEKEKTLDAAKYLREVDLSSGIQRTIVSTWDYTLTTFSSVLPVALIKIINLIQGTAKISELANANNQVVSMVTWSNNNAPAIKLTELSIERFNKLLQMIRDKNTEPGNKIEYHTHDQPSLILDHLTFKYKQTTILTIEYLEFEKGKYYAVTGKLGSGKSIVLKYGIFGIKHTGIESHGDVTYPANKNIVFATQNDYIPLESTLYEVIMTPKTQAEANILKETYFIKIKNLMHDLKVDILASELETVKDWGKTLSGGQKKMVAVMRAILQEPKQLLADELFNGMDENSIQLTQYAFKKYLPNATIIFVDHHAVENNHYGFYDGGKIHVEDKKAVLMKMDINPTPSNLGYTVSDFRTSVPQKFMNFYTNAQREQYTNTHIIETTPDLDKDANTSVLLGEELNTSALGL
jgi:branched-chain amino acid transport system ATP-binding protein